MDKLSLSRRDFLKLGGLAALTSVGGGLGGGKIAVETDTHKPKPEYFKTWEEMDGVFDPGYILIGESQTQESSGELDHRIYPLMQLGEHSKGFVDALSKDPNLWETVTGAIRENAVDQVKGAQYMVLKVDTDGHIKGLNE